MSNVDFTEEEIKKMSMDELEKAELNEILALGISDYKHIHQLNADMIRAEINYRHHISLQFRRNI